MLHTQRLVMGQRPTLPIGRLPFERPTGPSPGGLYPIDELYAQILIWHPTYFPRRPERCSNPVRVTLWSDGSLTGLPTGLADGIRLDLDVDRDSGGAGRVGFPFSYYR